MVKNNPTNYYAVIFTSKKSNQLEGYQELDNLLFEEIKHQKGFLGLETARGKEVDITNTYWDSLDAIRQWKNQADHQYAQEMGKKKWYTYYRVRICLVEHDYEFEKLT